MEDLTGHQLGPYRIVAPLGEGGMAAVYKAYQPGVDRYVAIKILPRHMAGDPKFSRRFEQEAKVIANLQHINILPVHDYGQDQDYTYLVMPFVESGTLADLMKGEPLPLLQVQQIISQVGDALDYAHTRGILHRDIKPSNILMDARSNCLLTDFGISKILTSTTQLTGTGDVIGTPAYMSPEQGLGHELDQRSDIYSLGVVLYEMVTGRQPYRAETPMAVIIKHIHDPLPLPHTLNPAIPEAVERVILKALAKDREQRFKTAGEMVAALNTAVTQKQELSPGSIFPDNLETLVATDQPSQFKVTSPGTIPIATIWWQKTWMHIPLWVWVGLVVILTCIFFVVWTISRPNPVQDSNGTVVANDAPTIQIMQDEDTTLSTTLPLSETPTSTPTPEETRSPTATPSPTQTSTPTLGLGSTQISPQDDMVMVYVPAGDFIMGSADGGDDERPVHNVFLDAFWIDQTEITVRQYNLCVKAGSCNLQPYQSPDVPVDYYTNPTYSEYPAVDIPWQSAVSYCNWAGRRLPTEAEWEKAARGTDELTFPWGNMVATNYAANYCDSNCDLDWKDPSSNDGYKYRSPVGSYPGYASPYGALDMAGNVWEWVNDWYSDTNYTTANQNNPLGPPTGSERVVRGGSWGSTLQNLRTAKRFHRGPTFWFGDIGFRCALLTTP